MPHYYFDCMLDGVVHADEFGIDMSEKEVSAQSAAVVWNVLEDSGYQSLVIFNIRVEGGIIVYVAYGVLGGAFTARAPPAFLKE